VTDLAAHTNAGDIELINFDDDYRAAKSIAALPLESADLVALVAKAKSAAESRGLLLPDADALLERCIVAILGGHVILQGPPGTGKTTLAFALAEAFEASAQLETATADWSTYDVIGGLHPSARKNIDTLEPWLGHVPRAAVQCANVIAEHKDPNSEQPMQAHWLVVDEFNRAEIDKAIGPLYTVLGGGGDSVPLPLWFGDAPERQVVWIPQRFRIIGTMNTVDTNYVNSFSQGLARRFQFVYIGVPEKAQVAAELERASQSAGAWYSETYGDSGAELFSTDPRVAHINVVIQGLLEQLRYDDVDAGLPGWPIGTAQLLDIYRQVALRLPTAGGQPTALMGALDSALADRLIPQASNLRKVQQDAIDTWLASQSLPRTALAFKHLRSASATGY
jgi:5-methylcytosine-specific restriction protein B